MAMLKVDAILQALDPEDQSAVALEVYRCYYRPPTLNAPRNGSPPTLDAPHAESNAPHPELAGTSQYVVSSSSSTSVENRLRNEEAKQVLSFLNAKTGRSFRTVEANLSLIKSALKSGATLEECKGVIARKVREWKGTDYEKYIRPATLFNKTKFEQYIGEQGT